MGPRFLHDVGSPQSTSEGDKTEIEEERKLLGCVKATLQQIDLVHSLVERFPSVFGFVQCAADIMPHFRAGRIASLIGVEGLHQIGNSASVLRMYHRLGVRYVTLTHDCNNRYADSAVSWPSTKRSPLRVSERQLLSNVRFF